MKRRCPNLNCSEIKSKVSTSPKTLQIVRRGTYYRRSDERRITRYQCRLCGQQFSSATFDLNYRQKRREINAKVNELLCSGISQRRLARVLSANPKTIVRKFRFLANLARHEHDQWLRRLRETPVTRVQFDDLETNEHTKCKPVNVTLAVHENSREILGFRVSRMPAKGHLAKIAKRKYGHRKDDRPKAWDEFFLSLKSVVSPSAHFKSDENPHYKSPLKRHFPLATHQAFLGARGAIAGQGELKKLRFDPLFSLNHTCAMLRANLNRLFRRTWCTTKTLEGLIDHLSLYVVYHNQHLLVRGCSLKGGS
jgi:transposase-like protein